MTHQVTLNPINATFRADGHETVLEASLRHDLLVPYGCRTGGCGACRAKITAGTVDHGKASETTLTPADREAGFALLCCAVPQTDVVVEVKDVRRATDIPVKTLPSRIEGLEKPAADVAVLTLRLPATEMFQFHAGQYVDILLKDGKRRSFSIANPPHDAATIELHVRHVLGGLFTDQVFSTMKVRDILRFNGPHGSFYLRESDKPMILLAGGTGFAPIKSIVLETLHLELQRPMHIYWGARDRAGLYQYEVAEAWAAQYPHIQFIPVLSEPELTPGWSGRTGLVHEAVLADFPDISGHEVYACGAPGMIAAARADYQGKGNLPEDAFFADSFEFAAN